MPGIAEGSGAAFDGEGRGAAAAAAAAVAGAETIEKEEEGATAVAEDGKDSEEKATEQIGEEGAPATAATAAEGANGGGGEEVQFGVLQVKEASFPETIAAGGPANAAAAAPRRFRSSLQPQCVPRPWQSYGAGYRKPAKLDKFNQQYFDHAGSNPGGGNFYGDGEDAAGHGGRGAGSGGGGAASEAYVGASEASEGGGRQTLVPRVVDAAGEATRQMYASALEASEAAAAQQEAAREAEVGLSVQVESSRPIARNRLVIQPLNLKCDILVFQTLPWFQNLLFSNSSTCTAYTEDSQLADKLAAAMGRDRTDAAAGARLSHRGGKGDDAYFSPRTSQKF